MAINLQRCLGTTPDPGQYTRRTESGRAAICCPGCAKPSELAATHTVTPMGVVKYAWKCPTVDCPFLEFLTLDSYSEPVLT